MFLPTIEEMQTHQESKLWDKKLVSYLAKHEQGLFLEAYYGKNPLLLEIEQQFDVIKGKIIEKNRYNAWGSKESKIIEKNIKKLFNVENCNLSWETNTLGPNAYTYPVTTLMFQKESTYKLKKGKYGIEFDDPKGKMMEICLTNALFLDANLTTEEITGCLLHEIGHNFFFDRQKYLNTQVAIIINLIIGIVQAIMSKGILVIGVLKTLGGFFPGFRQASVAITNKIKDNPHLQALANVPSKIMGGVMDMVMKIDKVVDRAMTVVSAPIQNWKLKMIKRDRSAVDANAQSSINDKSYQDEKFSDNFATSYGYGPALTSALGKFEITFKGVKANEKDTKYGAIKSHEKMLADYIELGSSGHPMYLTRVKDQIRLLKAELKKNNLSKAAIKQMKADIQEIEKTLYNFEDDDFLKQYGMLGTKVVRASMEKIFGTREDPREQIAATQDYDYEEMLFNRGDDKK